MDSWEEGPNVSLVTTDSNAPQETMSAQDSCLSLIKYLLFVFNLFFFVLGSLIFCFGIWILVDKTSFVSFVGLSFVPLQIWSKALAVSGVLTMGLALLGCVGALKELRCLLGLYFWMLLLLFVTQITLGILISTQKTLLERKVKDMVLETIQNYHVDPEKSAAEESWDYVQFQLRCCGWNSPRDWSRVPSLSNNASELGALPCSCYNSSAAANASAAPDLAAASASQFSRGGRTARPRHGADLCAADPAHSSTYREGCARSLQKWLHNNLISIVGICLGVGLLEVSVVGLSLLLPRGAIGRKAQPQVPGAEGSGPGPGPSAAGGNGRGGGVWGGWGVADACPSWGDKAPQGKLPMALGPWPFWDPDEEQPETGSAGAEVATAKAELEAEAEAEGQRGEPPE